MSAIAGAVTTRFEGPSGETPTFRLDTPATGIIIPPGWWLDLTDFTHDSCLLAAASAPYDESDYIRDRDTFREYCGRR